MYVLIDFKINPVSNPGHPGQSLNKKPGQIAIPFGRVLNSDHGRGLKWMILYIVLLSVFNLFDLTIHRTFAFCSLGDVDTCIVRKQEAFSLSIETLAHPGRLMFFRIPSSSDRNFHDLPCPTGL